MDLKSEATPDCPCRGIMNCPGVRACHELWGCAWRPKPSPTTIPLRVVSGVRNASLVVAAVATVVGTALGAYHVPVTWTAFGSPLDARDDHTHDEPGRNPIYVAGFVASASGSISTGTISTPTFRWPLDD